ncbi:MAG: hypothetical protein J5992_03695 [Oscillospiraceae bacterium]|nr:hypothetical protein [Oscillospiraceae bacterium]
MKNSGIILRVDYEPFTTNISRICCFCKDCDPDAGGGKGGYLPSMRRNDEYEEGNYQTVNKYCSTCGKEIDYTNVTIVDKYGRSKNRKGKMHRENI